VSSSLEKIQKLRQSIQTAILGKPDVIDSLLVCLLGQGHLLIEDVPGVGKTTLALATAKSIDGLFQRIQFTSDLLPSDVIGVTIYNSAMREFEFKSGPLFTNILLADEINRTTPKTQSALLEAMQDTAVTVDLKTHPLPKPFMVIATQNPIEFHGTYPLPESQLDRFFMRISMGYPAMNHEKKILETKGKSESTLSLTPVCTGKEILEFQNEVTKIHVDQKLTDYMLRIVEKTRNHPEIELGVSTRGALALFRAVQAKSFIQGRDFATPDDVKNLIEPLFCHRLILSGKRSVPAETKDNRVHAVRVLREIITSTEVPV